MNAITRTEFDQLALTLKPRLRRELRFSPETITDWGDRDFIVITNKQGNEGVLVVPFEPVAILPFAISRREPNSKGRVEAIICDICATWQRGTHSGVITFTASPIRTVSFLCCGDLQCSLHVRDKTPAAILSRAQLREHISPDDRIARLRQRLRDIITVVQG